MTKATAKKQKETETLADSGASALEFLTLKFPTSSGRYHAFGAYRRFGRIVIRHIAEDFVIRVPRNARELFFRTYDHLCSGDDERDNARYLASRWSGFPETFQALLER